MYCATWREHGPLDLTSHPRSSVEGVCGEGVKRAHILTVVGAACGSGGFPSCGWQRSSQVCRNLALVLGGGGLSSRGYCEGADSRVIG